MKELRCADVIPECESQFAAPTEESLIVAFETHARRAHALRALPPDLSTKVRALIRTSAA